MQEIYMIIVIAIALSMDTFSAALSLGIANIRIKKAILLSVIVGIFHFIMPLIGMIIGKNILALLPFDYEYFLAIIFLVLSMKMIYNLFIENKEAINLNIFGIILFSLTVSFDAFTTGIGLFAITNKILLSTVIFMIISYLFTIFGILIGKYVNKKIGKLSSFLGIIILIIMGLYLII